MRRLVCALAVVTTLAALVAAGSGCGSSAAQPSSSPGGLRQLFNLTGFDLRSGHPCRVSFASRSAPKLRIIGYIRGRGPAPGADPALTCRLERVDGSHLVPVGLKAREHAAGEFWIYAAEATGPLPPGHLPTHADRRRHPPSLRGGAAVRRPA